VSDLKGPVRLDPRRAVSQEELDIACSTLLAHLISSGAHAATRTAYRADRSPAGVIIYALGSPDELARFIDAVNRVVHEQGLVSGTEPRRTADGR
jgi:hypothetical protein